jgi:hypothetical protein
MKRVLSSNLSYRKLFTALEATSLITDSDCFNAMIHYHQYATYPACIVWHPTPVKRRFQIIMERAKTLPLHPSAHVLHYMIADAEKSGHKPAGSLVAMTWHCLIILNSYNC